MSRLFDRRSAATGTGSDPKPFERLNPMIKSVFREGSSPGGIAQPIRPLGVDETSQTELCALLQCSKHRHLSVWFEVVRYVRPIDQLQRANAAGFESAHREAFLVTANVEATKRSTHDSVGGWPRQRPTSG